MRRLPVVLFTLMMTFPAAAQELEQILEDHYRAAAQEKMQKVETMVTRGTNIYSGVGIETDFVLYQARPNKLRIEGEFQGSQVIQTYNGQTGWMYAPSMGIDQPQEMTPQEVETVLNQSEFENPLWNYEERGNTLEFLGTVEEENMDHMKLTTDEGDELHFYLDRESHLIAFIRSTQVMGGSETEVEVNLSEYKNVKGIPVAHRMVTKMGGEEVTTVQIDKVEINKKLGLDLFEKPQIE